MKITIITIDDGDEIKKNHTPVNKGKRLEELYDNETVKRIRRRIRRAQLRRYQRERMQ